MTDRYNLDSGYYVEVQDYGHNRYSVLVKRADGVTVKAGEAFNQQDILKLSRPFGKMPGSFWGKYNNTRRQAMKTENGKTVRDAWIEYNKKGGKLTYDEFGAGKKGDDIMNTAFANGCAKATQEIFNKLNKVENSLSTIRSDFKSGRLTEQQAIKDIIKDQNRRNSTGMEDSPIQMIKKWKAENAGVPSGKVAVNLELENGANSAYAQGKIRKIEQIMSEQAKGIGTSWESGAVKRFVDAEFQGLPKGYADVSRKVKSAATFSALKDAMNKLDQAE